MASWTSSESAWTTPWRRQEELRGGRGTEPEKMVVFCLPRESLELGCLSMKHMTDLTESGIAIMIRQEYGGVSGVPNIFFWYVWQKKYGVDSPTKIFHKAEREIVDGLPENPSKFDGML